MRAIFSPSLVWREGRGKDHQRAMWKDAVAYLIGRSNLKTQSYTAPLNTFWAKCWFFNIANFKESHFSLQR